MGNSRRMSDVATDLPRPHAALLYRRRRAPAPEVQVGLPKQQCWFPWIGGGLPIDGPHSCPNGTEVRPLSCDRGAGPNVPANARLIEQASASRFGTHHMQAAIL